MALFCALSCAVCAVRIQAVVTVRPAHDRCWCCSRPKDRRKPTKVQQRPRTVQAMPQSTCSPGGNKVGGPQERMTATERWSETDTDLMPRPTPDSTIDPRNVTPITEPGNPDRWKDAREDDWVYSEDGYGTRGDCTRAAEYASITEMHGGGKARRGGWSGARAQAALRNIMQKGTQSSCAETQYPSQRRQDVSVEQCETILWAGDGGRATRIVTAPTQPYPTAPLR